VVGHRRFHVARWFWWRVNAYTEITALVLGPLFGIVDLCAAKFAKESYCLLLKFYAAGLCLGCAALGAVRVALWYQREIALC
jgi:hypothetical protein